MNMNNVHNGNIFVMAMSLKICYTLDISTCTYTSINNINNDIVHVSMVKTIWNTLLYVIISELIVLSVYLELINNS